MTSFEIALPDGSMRRIGGPDPCFIIAEIGTNWYAGSRDDDEQARRLIDAAAAAGCDAVKFQTYSPESVYAPNPGESSYLGEAGIARPIDEVIAERYAVQHAARARGSCAAQRHGVHVVLLFARGPRRGRPADAAAQAGLL
jgi:hypothetical protein